MGVLDAPGYTQSQAQSLFVQRSERTAGDLMVIADAPIAHASPSTSTAVGTAFASYVIGVDASLLQLVFGMVSNNGTGLDTDPGATLTFSASVEISAVKYRLTFGGKITATLDPGAVIAADTLDVAVTAGTTIWVWVYTSAGTWPIVRSGSGAAGGAGFVTTTDLTASGSSNTKTATNSNLFMPLAILGVPDKSTALPKTWAVYGTSVDSGTGERNGDRFIEQAVPRNGMGGYWRRAFSGTAGIMTIARASDRFDWYLATGGHHRRGPFSRYASRAFIGGPVNDLANGQTAQTVANNVLSIAKLARRAGQRVVWVGTCTPYRVTTTDTYATVANQTADSTNATRVTYNNWLRAGAPIDPTAKTYVTVGTAGALVAGQTGHPFTGYVELADVVESSRDSGKWKAAERVGTGDIAIGNGGVLTSTDLAFTSADYTGQKELVIVGAGTTGATLVTYISIVNSATSVNLANGAATTVTGARVLINPYTKDGDHPGVGAHQLLAAALVASGINA